MGRAILKTPIIVGDITKIFLSEVMGFGQLF